MAFILPQFYRLTFFFRYFVDVFAWPCFPMVKSSSIYCFFSKSFTSPIFIIFFIVFFKAPKLHQCENCDLLLKQSTRRPVLECPYRHDPQRVTVCRRFLRGAGDTPSYFPPSSDYLPAEVVTPPEVARGLYPVLMRRLRFDVLEN